MVRLLNIVTVLFTSFVAAQRCGYCQCLYSDGSHCCVQSAPSGDLDCQAACSGAQSAGLNQFEPGPSCNAGGKYTCLSAWNAHFRHKCQGYPT
ncbi:hypothetical protein F53441_1558 [Fusarium austroafricanum]|uniref:Secreted protein n=1 Tax=Fusarium austroafricanum TaxID=2364996 RepID=A0A8H4KV71_9HYPO|nr:hypothetical protein F53441_1558 [Fusarium austroafricanum]